MTAFKFLLLLIAFAGASCAKTENAEHVEKKKPENGILHAKGLAIYHYENFTLVEVSNPWPSANQKFSYILSKDPKQIPDSLSKFPVIRVPVKRLIATSTTHIPSIEMLGMEQTLVGFPNLKYISSRKTRELIDAGKVRELGSNQSLNTEVVIDTEADVIIGYGIDNNNPVLDNLIKSGQKIILNGDWNEQTPLGKAEWIKLFGALYGLDQKAADLFESIEKDYNATLALAKTATSKPSVLAGAVYENRWYLPQGNSWGALTIRDAAGNYLWQNENGTGSLSLPFETVFEKAHDAEFWIGPAEFTSLEQMKTANPHYSRFRAWKEQNVYSFSSKKGKTGGVIYYELAPNRPDIVLKDVLKILHPELLPDHQLFFFEKLK